MTTSSRQPGRPSHVLRFPWTMAGLSSVYPLLLIRIRVLLLRTWRLLWASRGRLEAETFPSPICRLLKPTLCPRSLLSRRTDRTRSPCTSPVRRRPSPSSTSNHHRSLTSKRSTISTPSRRRLAPRRNPTPGTYRIPRSIPLARRFLRFPSEPSTPRHSSPTLISSRGSTINSTR